MRADWKKGNRGIHMRSIATGALAGLILGAGVSAAVIMKVMPGLMIVTSESRLGLDETVAALQESIPAKGWVVAGVRDMNKSLAKNGVEFKPQVRLIELCQPEYASSVLGTERYVSTLMPCTIGVWEGEDGRVYLSRMNMGLMAKMFGGNIAEVMGGSVARDEAEILSGILKD